MRDTANWRRRVGRNLEPWQLGHIMGLADFLETELVLSLMHAIAPHWTAIDGWVLFTGHPFPDALGLELDDEQRIRLSRARFFLPNLRRQEWKDRLERYTAVPDDTRAFVLDRFDAVPSPRSDRSSTQRLEDIAELLATPTPFRTRELPLAGQGEYVFWAGERQHSVDIPAELAGAAPAPFTVDHELKGQGRPVVVSRSDLVECAAEMDAAERANLFLRRKNNWSARLARVELLVRAEANLPFEGGEDWTMTLDGLLHLVGMVGAGKSTVRDILTVHCVRRLGLRVGLIVPDVAESLAVVNTLTTLGVRAAPILGRSTRAKHLRRLHRRQYGPESPTLLHHRHPSFDHLSSACPLDALRGLERKRVLGIDEAPCTSLRPTEASPEGRFDRDRHGCPLWSACPRHHAWRELQAADVWTANPWSLVYTSIPEHQTEARVRVLEMMARHCDVIVCDEADRVQLQFDTTFAPAVVLYGRGRESWLDELTNHQIRELADAARSQLSDDLLDQWLAAVATINTAANLIFGLLLRGHRLRDWAGVEFFSAFTLHHRLLNDWFEEPEPGSEASPARERASRILNRFRDDPLMQQTGPDPDFGADPGEEAVFADMQRLTFELIAAGRSPSLRRRLTGIAADLSGDATPSEESVSHLEFTLLVATLHHRLNFLTWGWRAVEARLNLAGTSNPLQHNPPADYEPVVPESPIGNILGFQFLLDDLDRGPEGGSLKFFRCLGLGRALLRRLGAFCEADDRPSPHVILMSATSWAGTSTRYHLGVPVKAVLRPKREEVNRIAQSSFRKEPLYADDGKTPLRLSGTHPRDREAVLRQMLRRLAAPEPGTSESTSAFELELDELDADRRRILLLTGSYAEAEAAFAYLDSLPRWKGKTLRLVADDTEGDSTWGTLRRGDVAAFPERDAEILVAPMLAVERGHNIVVDGGRAAFGTVYFLARPHDPPDDINLSIHALNDWAQRFTDDGQLTVLARSSAGPDETGRRFRSMARQRWRHLVHRKLTWSTLDSEERVAFTWDQMVAVWQVIGRLVRGGVSARVVFVDAAFAPLEAAGTGTDTPKTSLLESMKAVLAAYFESDPATTEGDRYLVAELYRPLYEALDRIDR